jgi:hypothetical protein
MKISIEKLRVAADRGLSYIAEKYGTEIELDHDYYWSLPKQAKYDVLKEAKVSEVGSLVEDYQQIEKIVKREHDLVGYDLAYIAAILRALGEELA